MPDEQELSIANHDYPARGRGVSKTGQWMVKSLLISAVVALITVLLFYGFFAIHKELEVRPASAFWLGLLAFLLSAAVSTIYFRFRPGR
jgi:hypothetical protein